MGAAMYAAGQADAAARPATPATEDADDGDDDVVDAEIVDDEGDEGEASDRRPRETAEQERLPDETEVPPPADVPDGGAGRLGPETVDEPAAGAPYETPEEMAPRIGELTADLQRLQAEYVNYKRRVDRDRDLVLQNAKFSILSALLPVLDDVDRAREHEELDGGFKAVAESLERIVAGEGLVKFGADGRPVRPAAPRGAHALAVAATSRRRPATRSCRPATRSATASSARRW